MDLQIILFYLRCYPPWLVQPVGHDPSDEGRTGTVVAASGGTDGSITCPIPRSTSRRPGSGTVSVGDNTFETDKIPRTGAANH